MAAVAALGLFVLLGASTFAFASDEVRREGACSSGGDWRLEVRHEDATTLRVRLRIEQTPPGDVWEVFLSDNGRRFFAGTRTASSTGEVRVTRFTKDLAGTDKIKGYAYSRATGETCSAALAYDR
jgi:hypothetical protein